MSMVFSVDNQLSHRYFPHNPTKFFSASAESNAENGGQKKQSGFLKRAIYYWKLQLDVCKDVCYFCKNHQLTLSYTASFIRFYQSENSIYVHKKCNVCLKLVYLFWFLLIFSIHTILLSFSQNENQALCIYNYSNINNFSKLWNLFVLVCENPRVVIEVFIIELSEIYQKILFNIVFGEQKLSVMSIDYRIKGNCKSSHNMHMPMVLSHKKYMNFHFK